MLNQAHRGLIYRRFGADEELQRRAMRVFTFFDVVGYSAGALLGGFFFDANGGYDAAIGVCAAISAIGGVAVAPLIWSEPLRRGRSRRGTQVLTTADE